KYMQYKVKNQSNFFEGKTETVNLKLLLVFLH
ncbi:unnamed protein product, partial [marine sediment metagenome]